MAVLIDSSVFITIERRGLALDVLDHVAANGAVALSAISASELLVGVHRAGSARQRRHRHEVVEQILRTVPVLIFDAAAARVHAGLVAHLTSIGQPIGAHDLLIAATALLHGRAVLTENLRDYQRVPGLLVRQPAWPV